LIIILFINIYALSAQVTIKGKVLDAHTKEPVIDAMIYSITSEKGTTTDFSGSFSFESPDYEDTLLCSYLGYATSKISLKDSGNIVFQLVPEVMNIQEV